MTSNTVFKAVVLIVTRIVTVAAVGNGVLKGWMPGMAINTGEVFTMSPAILLYTLNDFSMA